jgi:hypothetical protein
MRLYWPLPENEIDNLEQKTIQYSNLIQERYGKSIGIIKVKEEKISDFALRETYILRYNINGLRFIYTYYKSSQGRILNTFKWDDSISEEFKVQ